MTPVPPASEVRAPAPAYLPERWCLVLVATPGESPVGRRVARLLKQAARLGLRCEGLYNDVPHPMEAVELVEE